MIGALLYAASLGLIGLVSYVWLSGYVDLPWPGRKSRKGDRGGDAAGGPSQPASSTATSRITPSSNNNSSNTVPAAAAANSKSVNKKNDAKNTPSSPPSSSSVAAVPQPPELPARPSVIERKKKGELLSMALHSPPALPKRPMINILHAPTLTKSFSPPPLIAADATSAGADAPPLSPLPADSSDREAKMAAHREQVAWEIVSSEEKYIQCLNILMTVYFHPLKAKAEKGSAKLTLGDFSLLFSNIEPIWRFHQLFLPALKTSPNGDVAAVVDSFSPYLKMYTKYVADYSPALQTISRLNKNADFVRFLKKQRESPVSEGLDIMSVLITPIQRIPRYLLLLKELQKWTPASHPHAASLIAAISKVATIADFINESQRRHENASTLLELQHQISGMADADVQLFQPHRRLVRHGILRLLKQEGTANASLKPTDLDANFSVMLFNDTIIFTTLQYEYRGQLNLQGCVLNTDNLRVEVVRPKTASHRAQMSLRLECPSLDEADKWTASLRESIEAANELVEKDERRKSAAHSLSISK